MKIGRVLATGGSACIGVALGQLLGAYGFVLALPLVVVYATYIARNWD